ncbi:MAG: hypothetical protein ACRDRX_14025 [Pseudonocardiaceae bacterium]
MGVGVTALVAIAGLRVLRPDSPPLASPLAVLGDPRTADPCALTDSAPLTPFSNGTMSKETAYGNFNRCDVVLTRSGGTRVQIKVEFEKPAPPKGTMEELGAFRVFKQPDKSGFCGWTVPLADQNLVTITAKLLTDRGPAYLCGMAKAETRHVVAVLTGLGKGAIPRRAAPPEPESLAWRNACALLDSTTVTRVLDAGASSPESGFGDWECRWHSSTSGLSVLLAFDRNKPLTEAEDGHREVLSDHEVYIGKERDQNNCRARVVYRPFRDGNGKRPYELLKITVEGPQTPAQMCGSARELAAAAAAKLPQSR